MEREQKRQFELSSGEYQREGLAWVYYGLGGDKKQLSVWNGVQGTWCLQNNHVFLWPVEYNSYGPMNTRIITRAANGEKETVFTDHLGSTVQVRRGVPEYAADQRAYTAFGENMEVPNDPIIGRTGYIGRETDKESELGFYGVRQYDAGYGRFLSVDPLWALYPNLTSFHYAMNNPVTMLDQGGKWVQAMNEGARDAIRTSVPSQFRDAVQFNDNGFLQIESLKEAAKGQDVNSNIAILSRLAENDHTIQVNVGETFEYKDEQGAKQKGGYARVVDGALNVEQGDTWKAGMTFVPKQVDGHEPVKTSVNGLIQVSINPNAKELGSRKTLGQVAAHELFAHVRLYLLVVIGKASVFGHDPDKSKQTPDHPVEKAVIRAEKEAGSK